ncbi:MAG: CHASE2 domain-containing protein, partial [Coleofasciculus sp. S288]|nr:CHASE2 domain-containing protein [Coleofasciculus sp. S288]
MTALLIGVRQLGILQPLELNAFDRLMRGRPDEGPDQRLLVVGITEADLQTLQQYPLSDQTIADLLEKLEQYKPRAIGLDIFRDIPTGKGRAALKTLLEQPNIIVVCAVSRVDDPGVPPPPELPAEQVGFADLPIDLGGTLRRSTLVTQPPSPETPFPKKHLCNDPSEQLLSLPFQLSRLYLQPQGIEPELTEEGELKMGSTVFKRLEENSGGYQNADARDYQMLINYRSPRQVSEQVSLLDVLNDKIHPELVRDRIVLIGSVASSNKDAFYTPYSAGLNDAQKMPGVVVHAQIVSQILSAVLDGRPLIRYWPQWAEFLWIWSASLVGGLVAWYIRHPWRFALAEGAAIGVFVGACYGLFLVGVWVPLVPPALALVGTAVGVVSADRFRNYAGTIYQGVKKGVQGLLKIEVQIDKEKKEKQVAEITESDYFKTLQQRAITLRNRKDDTPSGDASPSNRETQDAKPANQESESADEIDYFQQLQQRRK